MKKLSTLAFVLAAIGAGAGVVQAGSHHSAAGTIEHLNSARHSFVLDKHTYRYSPKIAAKALREGARVKVFYSQSGGHRTAHKVMLLTS